MNKKLYVSNLAFSMRDGDLEKVFTPFGPVISAKVVMDRFSGRSKGFGFVEMENEADAVKAIREMNGKDVDGRLIRVLEANSKPDDRHKDNNA
jgi:RNA recognition motif-containing protein